MSRSYCQRHFPVRRLERHDAIGGAADVDQVGADLGGALDGALAVVRPANRAALGIDGVEAAVVGPEVHLPARGVEARLAVDAARHRRDPVEVAGLGRHADHRARARADDQAPAGEHAGRALLGRRLEQAVLVQRRPPGDLQDAGPMGRRRRVVQPAHRRGGAARGGDAHREGNGTEADAGAHFSSSSARRFENLVAQRGGRILVQHLVIDPRRPLPGCLAARRSAPRDSGPGPCRSRPG